MAPQNRLEKLTFKKLQTNGAYCPLIRNLNGLIRRRAWLANLSKISQENEGQEIIQLPLTNLKGTENVHHVPQRTLNLHWKMDNKFLVLFCFTSIFWRF